MKFSPRVLSMALVLGLVGASASYSCVSWNNDLGLDFWNAPALKDDLAQQQRVRLALNLRDVVVLQRIAVKEQVVQAVIDGQLGLLEAAARFYMLNATESKLMADVRKAFPSANDDECMCRNVIDYVKHQIRDDHHPLPRQLQAELDQLLAAGTVRLPTVPADAN